MTASHVPCPDCNTSQPRSALSKHTVCPDCGTMFHQNWQTRTRNESPSLRTRLRNLLPL